MRENTPATYRSSLLIPWSWVLGYSVGVISLVILVIEGGRPDWRALLYAILGTAMVSILFCAVLVAYFTVELTPQGIRGYNFWGRYRFVPWSSMCATKHVNLGGLRYVRVFSENESTPMWLPLFLHGMDAFETSVRTVAPEHNVLRAFFEERGD